MEITQEQITAINEIIDRGLTDGMGDRDGQMCIEAAISLVTDQMFGDDPRCVGPAVRACAIRLNDSLWSSREARSAGLRSLAFAQLGSVSLDQVKFAKRLAEQMIRVLIPALFRDVLAGDPTCLAAADVCESDGAANAAKAAYAAAKAAKAANAAYAANAAANAAYEANNAANAVYTANAAANAAAVTDDKYLSMAADIAVGVLREMGSPGVKFIQQKGEK